MGGEGTIEYFPLGLALVINQSPEVIEEVERLLESLRKLQDLEVSIEVKVVSLAETFYERIGVDFSMGIPTNARPIGGPRRQTISGSAGSTAATSAATWSACRPRGMPTPDLDIPIRATSFGRAVPPFGGFSELVRRTAASPRPGVPERHPGADVPGSGPGRHANERDAGPEADGPERDVGVDDASATSSSS